MLPKTTVSTSFDDDAFRFASEIAIRLLERRDGVTLDDVLCDPDLAAEFDRLAMGIAPGFSSLQYRWAALSLRKERELRPEVSTRLLRPDAAALVKIDDLDPAAIPHRPGVYVFLETESGQTLYVGEASNLNRRLATHLEHSDNKLLAHHFWDHGFKHVQIEYYVLPEGTSKRQLRAFEAEQIRMRSPAFNIVGRH